MTARNLAPVLRLVLSAALSFAAPVRAAEPSNGTIDGPNDEATWSGAFFASNPAVCATSVDPLCDHFTFTIASPSVMRVLIAIAPDEGFETDDYDLFVFDDQGVLLASQAEPTASNRS